MGRFLGATISLDVRLFGHWRPLNMRDDDVEQNHFLWYWPFINGDEILVCAGSLDTR